MFICSIANGLNSSGGFCAGSRIVSDHQRINGTSFVFLAAVPALLAVSASEGINILRNTPSILSTLLENMRMIRTVLDRLNSLTILSHAALPIIQDHPHSPTYCDAVVVFCGSEGSEPRYRSFVRCTVVPHCGRGPPLAGHRGRGARAERVDHKPERLISTMLTLILDAFSTTTGAVRRNISLPDHILLFSTFTVSVSPSMQMTFVDHVSDPDSKNRYSWSCRQSHMHRWVRARLCGCGLDLLRVEDLVLAGSVVMLNLYLSLCNIDFLLLPRLYIRAWS